MSMIVNCVNITENCDLPIAMAYVPMQKWRNIYDSEVGFDRGTIFEELDKPFLGEEVTPK
ncbi:MAG: spore coat associated protein CotJA [Clostridiales bacterium]|nr:spore coat associated protein CotJA [Clostridiales bacterium]